MNNTTDSCLVQVLEQICFSFSRFFLTHYSSEFYRIVFFSSPLRTMNCNSFRLACCRFSLFLCNTLLNCLPFYCVCFFLYVLMCSYFLQFLRRLMNFFFLCVLFSFVPYSLQLVRFSVETMSALKTHTQ